MKYRLSTRKILRAEPKGFPEPSGYISLYILTCVIIQTFSIYKSYTVGQGNIERVDSPYWSSSWGYIFPYYPVDEAISVHIDPVENSVVAALGHTHGQESNTREKNFNIILF